MNCVGGKPRVFELMFLFVCLFLVEFIGDKRNHVDMEENTSQQSHFLKKVEWKRVQVRKPN